MGSRMFVRRVGSSAIRKIAVLSFSSAVVSGCDTAAPLPDVKAVAAGATSLAPFFDEDSGLGRDSDIRSRPARGGVRQGDTPGLYGGTGKAAICDVDRLERYLADPRNDRKARAWADAIGIGPDGIPRYLDSLTPVLLRHDTLVENHDYKKGKAVPFPALLQAGIALLVDEHGLPAVKCSCGNPLRPFEGDKRRTSVTFDDRNEKWKGFDRSEVVVVRPAAEKLEAIALVDVADPGRGIERPVGTTGERDSVFATRERRAVPPLAGTTFGEASRRLAGQGLAVAFEGDAPPPDGARVTASDPVTGAELRFGEYVTLTVTGTPGSGTSGDGTTPAPPGPQASRATPAPGPSSPSAPSSARPPSPSTPSVPADAPAPASPPPSVTSPPDGPAPLPPSARTSPSSGPQAPPEMSGPPSGTTASSPSSAPPATSTPPPPTAPGPSSGAPEPDAPSGTGAPAAGAPGGGVTDERLRRTRE